MLDVAKLTRIASLASKPKSEKANITLFNSKNRMQIRAEEAIVLIVKPIQSEDISKYPLLLKAKNSKMQLTK